MPAQHLNLITPRPSRGFTLIELMITIAIIAIIAAVGLVSYSQSQKIARDARRKQDLQAIATALEFYYQKNGSFPKYSDALTGCGSNPQTKFCHSGTGANPWISVLDSNFINKLPMDPLRNNGDPQGVGNYGYGFRIFANGSCGTGTVEGQYFLLYTRLENTTDSELLSKKDQYLCPGITSLINAGYDGGLYVVTSK